MKSEPVLLINNFKRKKKWNYFFQDKPASPCEVCVYMKAPNVDIANLGCFKCVTDYAHWHSIVRVKGKYTYTYIKRATPL